MLGAIVNASAIIIGCTIGGLVKKGIPKNLKKLCSMLVDLLLVV